MGSLVPFQPTSDVAEFADIIIDSAVLMVGGVQLTLGRGGWKFDPGEEWEDYPFPGRTMNTVGARQLVRLTPKITGTALESGEDQISAFRPDGTWSNHATIAGARTFTPNALRAYLTDADYLTDVICLWKRIRGDYIAVEFPIAVCSGWKIGAADGDEGLIEVVIEAVKDNAATGKPYRVRVVRTTPTPEDPDEPGEDIAPTTSSMIRWTPTEGSGLTVTNKITPGTLDLTMHPVFPPDWVPGLAAYHSWDNVDSRLSLTFATMATELRTSAMLFFVRPTTLPTGGGFHLLVNGNRTGAAPGGLDGDTPTITIETGGAVKVHMASSVPGGSANITSSATLSAGNEATVGYVHDGSTLTVYVNGIASGSGACSLGIDWVLPPIIWIGAPHGNFTDRRADQDIGDFILWDGGLAPVLGTHLPNAAQMLANHNAMKATLYPGLP